MIELLPLRLEFCEKVSDIAKESLPESWSLNEIEKILSYSHNIYYVAIDYNEENENPEVDFDSLNVVGFAGIMQVGDEAELLNIAVTESYRRKGIGKMLLERLLDIAEINGMSRMLLEVRAGNETAKHLYQNHGFSLLTVRKAYYSNPKDDALIMECPLKRHVY